MTLAVTGENKEACGGSSNKGKGIMTETELLGVPLFGLQLSSGSEYANTMGVDPEHEIPHPEIQG